MEMENKLCLECENPVRGRSDKRFCDDSCRNAYNNRRNSEQTVVLRDINRSLRKNRKILQNILGGQKMVKASKEKLTQRGFSFTYLTHFLDTSKGNRYTFVYEYGYLPLENDHFLIVKKKE